VSIKNPYKIVTLLFVLILAGLYWQTFPALIVDWWVDPNYSHGFLVPLFSAFLIWHQWGAIKKLAPNGNWLGLLVLLGGIFMLVLGDIAAEEFLLRTSFIVLVAGLVLFHLGTEIFGRVAFPLAFLLFMVPLPAIIFNAMAFPLQELAAHNAEWTLDLLGVPVLRDGNVIHLKDVSLGVTEACSGIRSLISLLALAVAWAYLTLPTIKPMVVLVASAVPITIGANAGRVVLTGLVSQYFDAAYAQGFFHSFSGWIIFLFAFVCFVCIYSLIQLCCSVRDRRATWSNGTAWQSRARSC
jgi:exosortase